MKIMEIIARLDEVAVLSSWIDEIDYNGNDVLMTLLDGNEYKVYDVEEDIYDEWVTAPSKGKYWHGYVRDYYITMRV